MCKCKGGVLREGGGRGPTGGDITLVPLSPPTPLKNPEPVSLPPSRRPPPPPFPVGAASTHDGRSAPLLGTSPSAPVLPCRLSPGSPSPRLFLAYPASPQVGSRLRSRDRSIESLEYKELREASVEYKAAGAGPALQLERAPGRKPGERARRGAGGGWKVRLRREKSARWGNFHPARKGRRVSGENSPLSAGQGGLFTC